MKKSNISSIVKNKLCTSCGVCEACCPKKCIRFIDNDLTVTPMVDEETCVRCGICTQVCPGQGVDLDKMSNQQFHNDNCLYNKYVGYYRDAFVGYSMNYYDRFNSSSGGGAYILFGISFREKDYRWGSCSRF